jgi:predicted transposase YbfD/YdcC
MFANELSFLLCFEELSDPRQDAKVVYPLEELIFIAVCGAIANCDHWTDIEAYANQNIDWFRQYVPLENGIPSHDTLSRVFSLFDTETFAACLIKWTASLQESLTGQGIHLDGKTLRRSFDAAAGKDALQIVTAWAGDLHLCVGQLAVEEGSSELKTVPKLLDMMEISGAIITLDALHTQKSTVKKIREKEADYVLTVKGNQPKLYGLINQTFEELSENHFAHSRVRRHTTRGSSHGREELRHYAVFPAPQKILAMGWTDVRTIGMVYRERTVNGKTSEELIYFISSLPPKVRTIAKHVRDHWKVENQMHWSLDVTFAEDTSRIRKGSGPAITGYLRRLALSLVKRDTSDKSSLRLKRLKSSWCQDHLLRYLTGKQA